MTAVRNLRPGQVVAYDQSLYTVVSAERTNEGDEKRPWIVVLQVHGKVDRDERSLATPDFWAASTYADTEHFPVCAHCGGPWPCRELNLRDEIAADAKRTRRYELAGVCPACEEPVTPRQLRQTWPVNLFHFDRDQPVTFHLRRKCEDEARAYDEATRAAGFPSQLGYQSNPERTNP